MSLQFFVANAGHLAPYAILLLLYLTLSLQSEVLHNRVFAAPALALLLFFTGFREAITPDLQRYKEMYENIGGANSLSMEPSFRLISESLHAIGFDYHALFFTYSLITLLFVYLGIKNYGEQIKLSLLLFVLLPGYFLNMFVEMREVCAVAIAFYATSLLSQREIRHRIWKCLIFAALSVLFHYSAILYWVIFLLSRKATRKAYSPGFYLAILLGSLCIPTSALTGFIHLAAYPILPPKYQGYINLFMALETNLAESGQMLKSLIYIAIAVFFIFSGRSGQDDERYRVQLNLFVIGVVILNMTRSFADISRLAYFFLIYQITIFPFIVVRMRERSYQVLAAYSLFLFYFAQFVWGLFFYSEEAGSYVFLHYQNVLLSALR